MQPAKKSTIVLALKLIGDERVQLSEQQEIDIVRKLGESGDPASVQYLAPLLVRYQRAGLFAKKRVPTTVAKVAAQVITEILSRTRTARFAQIDHQMRSWSWRCQRAHSDWQRLLPEEIPQVEALPGSSDALLGILSCHSNGYVREAATRKLANLYSPLSLSFLMLRLNDWVTHTSKKARKAIDRRLTPEFAEAFVHNLPLVSRLENYERRDQSKLIAAIHALLLSDGAHTALLGGKDHEDYLVRREAYRLLGSVHRVDLAGLFDAALDDPDVIIRTWAARHIVVGEIGGEDLEKLVRKMDKDKHVAVRTISLEHYVNQSRLDAQHRLEAGLLDSSGMLRYFSRYYLENRGAKMDFVEFYREKVRTTQGTHLIAAIQGLGETGDVEAIETVKAIAPGKNSKTMKAVLNTVANLDPEGGKDFLVEALNDSRVGVCKQAFHLLEKLGVRTVYAKVAELAENGSLPHSRLAALRLVTKKHDWSTLPVVLIALLDEDETVRSEAEKGVRRWLHEYRHGVYAMTEPSRGALERATANFESVMELLPPPHSDDLSKLLKEKRTNIR